MLRSSMSVHGVKSIQQKVDSFEYHSAVFSTTKLVITDEGGNEFIVTCFSDQPVTVEEVFVESGSTTPVEEEAVPA